MNQPPQPFRAAAATVVRGFLMGGADVVPGVSGGTVALILGIYQRLVTAISHVDLQLLGDLRRARWRAAAQHLDLGFLAALGAGIGLGILCLGGLMNHLITSPDTRSMTLAAFFGMILASTMLVGRTISLRRPGEILRATLCGAAGAAFAFWLTGLSAIDGGDGYGYFFGCGLVAICAMILPGISGAYVLLILGAYVPLTDILKRLPQGDVNAGDLATVVVFVSGCAIGLIGFSKVLRWLLAHYHAATMAVLCGFMYGALRKIWPFQVNLTPDETDLKEKIFCNHWPESLNGEVIACLVIAVAALLFVLLIDRLGSADSPQQPR